VLYHPRSAIRSSSPPRSCAGLDRGAGPPGQPAPGHHERHNGAGCQKEGGHNGDVPAGANEEGPTNACSVGHAHLLVAECQYLRNLTHDEGGRCCVFGDDQDPKTPGQAAVVHPEQVERVKPRFQLDRRVQAGPGTPEIGIGLRAPALEVPCEPNGLITSTPRSSVP
jgi:hypothetical protein